MPPSTIGLSRDPSRSRLVITRRHGQAVHIGDTTVTVRIVRGEARLTIEADRHVKILRDELEPHS